MFLRINNILINVTSSPHAVGADYNKPKDCDYSRNQNRKVK